MESKGFLHEFTKRNCLSHHWTINWLIAKDDTTGSADKRNDMVLVCHAHLVLRKMFMLLKHTYWVKKTDLAPTEQFLEYSGKPIFRDRNDVIIFSE